MSEVEKNSDRRHYHRYRCALPIEIRVPEQSFPSKGETTDVSLGGCYVSSMFNLPVGKELEVKIWVGDSAVKASAVVRTSDPGVGNGIAFMNLDPAGAHVLEAYLAKLDLPADHEIDDIRSKLIM